MNNSYQVVVVGAGAAGFFVATRAAQRGLKTLLLEKNRKPAVKILMSGGTRCNLTQATDSRGIVEAFGRQGKFLHSALSMLGPEELIALFASEGVPTKIESTGKVFPVSNSAVDVATALRRMLDHSGANLQLDSPVTSIDREDDCFLLHSAREKIQAQNLILTTGGQSYPGCGTTGDGYAWAKHFGHKIIPPRPALVPLLSDDPWVQALSGVTIPDVEVRIVDTQQPKAKPLAQRRGSFLFTHFGLSGPAVMDVSRAITARPDAGCWQAVCDFLPHMSAEQILDQLTKTNKQTLGNLAIEWLPRRLVEALLAEAQISFDQRLAELSKRARSKLVEVLKKMPIAIRGSQGFKKAEVTAGGIDLREVDSRTMQSKLCPGLYLAGEILDLDGPIGGYNFQAAFSTGHLAGEMVEEN